ncbi:MAG TPA: septum formation initiator family protein [Candidatus Caccovicinus merdipullorum]|uniref:Septum formation initiator family protein n=1 Tax=Candidatus Caccovicinus merdipullorum TaxID=2840724 RepID=A0A9D1GK00_9FIRM|nr:septum formation initiator family protein [Candidatus Caccovicinus merdipullorum]
MKARKRQSRMHRRDRWGNRMALIGITVVVLSLAVVVNLKGASLRARDQEYQIKEENLMAQKTEEEQRTKELEERKIYVQTKQYIEEVAKEKLGLVMPDEILLKPSEDR